VGCCNMVLTASMAVGLCSVALQSINGGRDLMCARMEEVLSGAMVASSAGFAKFVQILTMKIARRFDGGDNFCSG
jgi:hypothetical protein